MKFGTFIQHAPAYKKGLRLFLTFAQGLSYGLSKSKNGVKSSLNFLWATFVDLPFFILQKKKKKLNSTK